LAVVRGKDLCTYCLDHVTECQGSGRGRDIPVKLGTKTLNKKEEENGKVRIHCIFLMRILRIIDLKLFLHTLLPFLCVLDLLHIVPVARLEYFRALKFSRLESFRALKPYCQIGGF
jgi:hypothetical protein